MRRALATSLLFLSWSLFLIWALPVSAQKPAATALPVNLARQAKATASSEYDQRYRAGNVIDGEIPPAGCQNDAGSAWCVRGRQAKDRGELQLAWKEPVAISELLLFGRTAFSMRECWRDYELLLNDEPVPAAKGRLEMTDLPQRISWGGVRQVHKLRLRFLRSYGGSNPGVSEVMAFGEQLSDDSLMRLLGWEEEYPEWMPAGLDRMLVVQRHELNPSHVYTYHAEGYKPGGGLYLFTPTPEGPKLEQLIDSTDGQILDCALSYDAREVLFSWKRGGRPYTEQFDRTLAPDNNPDHMYKIYRMNVDGSGLTCLTDGTSNNFNPCWLADGGIAFLSDRKPAFAYCFTTTSPVLYRMGRDGKQIKRLSANYLNDFTPSVGPDGRILYSRWEYVDRPAIPIQSLWSINPDGTGLSGVFGNRVLSPATFMEAKSIPGTDLLLCVLTSHNGPCRGAIGIIDRRFGPNAQAGIRNLTPEVNIGKVDQGNGNSVRGPYENPIAFGREHFLVSKRGAIVLRELEGDCEAVLLRPRAGLGFYSPTPIRPRMRPAVIPSLLPDERQSGPWASISLQNVYVGLEPHVRRGEIKRICVVQEIEKSRFAPQDFQTVADTKDRFARKIPAFGYQFPVVSCGATYAPKKVWGFATVEPDGSAHFKVPSGVPIYFMALDQHGRAVQRMRSFTHLMPGEKQGCVGCHADRNMVASAFRPGAPGQQPMAMKRPPQDLEIPEWGLGGFSYARIVQPVLDRHCVQCHKARKMSGGVDLSADKTDFFNVSYDILARKGVIGERHFEQLGVGRFPLGENPYISWISTYNQTEENILQVTPKEWGSPASLLADLLVAGHPDEDGAARVELAPDERQRVLTWIDLNVPYYGTSESNHYDRKGCRRLYPDDLDAVLVDVAQRRCASCHKQGIPRAHYTRILNPQENSFLLAPLALEAGGTQACGQAVFRSQEDPDYQLILDTFVPLRRLIEKRPRMDMPGAHSSCDLQLSQAGD